MILISAKEVGQDPWKVAVEPFPEVTPFLSDGAPLTDVKIETETVHGRIFCKRVDGETVRMRVGLTREVQEIFGLMEEAWQNLEEAHQNTVRQRLALEADLHTIKGAGLWQRVKWLFSGVQV